MEGRKSDRITRGVRLRGPVGVAIWCALLLIPLNAQNRQVERPHNTSAGGWTSSGEHRVGGSLSQSAAGLLAPGAATTAGIGFWHRPTTSARAVVRIPEISAEVGTRLTIPVILESSEGLLRYGPRSFRLKLRYNRSLLDPDPIRTPICQIEGNDCVMEVSGQVSGALVDTIARLEFTAMLGDAESTPLAIDTIIWERRAERRFEASTINGLFTLLGVCREGDRIRLIHTGPPASRLALYPNVTAGPLTLNFLSAESLPVTISLVDPLGREGRVVYSAPTEASRLYQVNVDLGDLSSGSYFMVMQGGETRIVERVQIRK